MHPPPHPTPPALPYDDDRELEELRAYLGDAYDPAILERHERAVMDELAAAPSELELYRTSRMYLYDLTAFARMPAKRPYHRMLTAAVPRGSRVLDYGCGIGSDGLLLLQAGYDVSFVDFANPSTEYLRWRLARRGFPDAPVYDLERDALPDDFALAWSFDVIEHVPDPFAFLAAMEATAEQLLVNFLDPVPDDTTLHHVLPVDALLRHAAGRDLREYRRLHERSHVVRYGRAAAEAEALARNLEALRHPLGPPG